jgi:hypothetical protein
MSETRVIAKTSDGESIFSILKDAPLKEATLTVMYDTRRDKWYDIEMIGVYLKFMRLIVNEYPDIIEVPPEFVERMKNEQKNYTLPF